MLVGVASARRGSAGRSLAARLLARLLTAFLRLGRVMGRGAACAGLWLLLRGVLGSGLVLALRSTEHSGHPSLRGQLSRFAKRCCGKHLFEVDGCRLLLTEMRPF